MVGFLSFAQVASATMTPVTVSSRTDNVEMGVEGGNTGIYCYSPDGTFNSEFDLTTDPQTEQFGTFCTYDAGDGDYHFFHSSNGNAYFSGHDYATALGAGAGVQDGGVITMGIGGGTATTTSNIATSSIEQIQENTNWGFGIFLASAWFIMWIFKRR